MISQGISQPLARGALATKSSKVQSPEEKNKPEAEFQLLGCYTATSSQANTREGWFRRDMGQREEREGRGPARQSHHLPHIRLAQAHAAWWVSSSAFDAICHTARRTSLGTARGIHIAHGIPLSHHGLHPRTKGLFHYNNSRFAG